MSYSPHTWTTGDVISASGLNNIENAIGAASTAIDRYNCVDILAQLPGVSETKEGVKFEWDGDICHVSASSQATASVVQNNFFKSNTSIPSEFKKGVKYRVIFDSDKVDFRIYKAVNGTFDYDNPVVIAGNSPNGETTFVFPEEANGCHISVAVKKANTPLDVTVVKPRILNTLTNKELESRTDSLANSISGVSQKVDILYKLTQGQAWDAESDTAEAYSKFVPAGAHAVGIETVGGKTIVMNQMVPKTAASTSSPVKGLTYTNNGDGTWTVNGTPTDTNCFLNLNSAANNHKFIKGHKYLMTKGTSANKVGLYAPGTMQTVGTLTGYGSLDGDVVFTANTDNHSSSYVRIQITNAVGEQINTTIMPQCFDLTLMFGKTVADTITTPEQAYALGVPRELIPYNTGELRSANVDAITIHDMCYLDQIVPDDGGTVSLISGNKYLIRAGSAEYIHTPSSTIDMEFEAGDEAFDLTTIFGEEAANITQVSDAYALGVPTYHVSNETSMIILGRETERMNIPAVVRALPGYGWSAGAIYNSIEYNADTDKWTYIQRVASVDMGTLTWNEVNGSLPYKAFYASVVDRKRTNYNILCAKYVTGTGTRSTLNNNEIIGYETGYPHVTIRDDSFANKTPDQVKTALNGVTLYYELETPVETDITDLMPPYGFLECNSSQHIVFHQTNGMTAVPNKLTYFIKLSEAIQYV